MVKPPPIIGLIFYLFVVVAPLLLGANPLAALAWLPLIVLNTL